MTKRQKKERALLLLAFAFMDELKRRVKEVSIKEITEADLIFTNIYKKLFRIRNIFADKRIADFLLKRVPDEISKTCDMALVAVIVLDWFKTLNLTKEIVITEDLEKLSIAIAAGIDGETVKNSIEFASELVGDVFPDQKGLIEFRKLTNRFPFSLIDYASESEKRGCIERKEKNNTEIAGNEKRGLK